MNNEILHVRVKKDYAQQLIDLLLKDDALENVLEEESFELSTAQKNELDVELSLRAAGQINYKNWDEIKSKYNIFFSTNAEATLTLFTNITKI